MSKFSYIDDLLFEFLQRTLFHASIDSKDQTILESISFQLSSNGNVTKLQADLVIKLLKKNKNFLNSLNLDYNDLLENPKWKNEFRIIDQAKEAFIEVSENQSINICLKFPYVLKKKFEEEILTQNNKKNYDTWDISRRLHILPLYSTNIVMLHDFLIENEFHIHQSFLDVLSYVEEIWNDQLAVIPHCEIQNDKVVLINDIEDVRDFWNERSTGNIDHDLLLSKLMGFKFLLENKPKNIFEKISSSDTNLFWSKNFNNFFKIFKSCNATTVVLLDRTDEIIPWLQEFVNAADDEGVSRDLIKVCFREDSDANSKLNQWIKDNSVGGKIEKGKIFVFKHKPAKWIFSEKLSVNFIVTNSVFPLTNSVIQKWILSKNVVLQLGPIKASTQKENKIVEL